MAKLRPSASLSARAIQTFCAAFFLLGLSVFYFSSTDRPVRLGFIDKLSGNSATTTTTTAGTAETQESHPKLEPSEHPIDALIRTAERDFNALLEKKTDTLEEAAEVYRQRRGRQPPPGFDLWHDYAKKNGAVMVEEFWDRIYHDLNPFWGLPTQQIRDQANSFLFRISVRHGNVTTRCDQVNRPWMDLWTDMVRATAQWLPDLDMPINIMDESRLFARWETVNDLMTKQEERKRIVPLEELKDTYTGLQELDAKKLPISHPKWNDTANLWHVSSAGCHPDSPARKTVPETNYTAPPPISGQYPVGSFEGYVSNATFASSPCDLPALRGLHGSFIEPISISLSPNFRPLFGGSKLPMNNEILLPPAMYWTEDPFYSGGDAHGIPWQVKQDGMIWRGDASGGRNRKPTWTRFQRHRFVSMVNGTSVGLAEETEDKAINFVLPGKSYYNLAARSAKSAVGDLGRWIKTWSNCAIVSLMCFPQSVPKTHTCSYSSPYFGVVDRIPMSTQYDYKYLPDVDGNSFSGRYRGFLGSTSAPIKATIYREWHDSRLVPWKHYIPMDNTFVDIYGIMEYFVGNEAEGIAGHDAQGEAIATSGKDWAERVLRREDMAVYVFRLLLEYARVSDDDRDIMGWKPARINVDPNTIAQEEEGEGKEAGQ